MSIKAVSGVYQVEAIDKRNTICYYVFTGKQTVHRKARYTMASTYAPRTMKGNDVSTQAVVRENGTIATVTIESFNMGGEINGNTIGINTQGIGPTMYMFIANGNTNYKLYPTMRKAINAAAKTTC